MGVRGKREGMVVRPDNPFEKARKPAVRLWCVAKRPVPAVWKRESAAGVTSGVCRIEAVGPVVHATTRRPSVSRMPEIGTYGLKGGGWKRVA
jgi:hypothetical protein